MNFVAIDVETANPDLSSICQIGVAKYTEGQLVEAWSELINPEDFFDPENIAIHGITEQAVQGHPTFPRVVDTLNAFLDGSIVVSHTSFDRVSMNQTYSKYKLPQFNAIWLDSARVARRTWDEFAWKGYGLSNVCNKIGYQFKHHDALEDAKASAQVLLAAIQTTGLCIQDWLERVTKPIDLERAKQARQSIKRDGNPQGDLYGEVVVFTGKLSLPRREAANWASCLGCDVAQEVTKKTTLLVVGDQDISKLNEKEKSRKYTKAQQLIKQGQEIRILKEIDFRKLSETACVKGNDL